MTDNEKRRISHTDQDLRIGEPNLGVQAYLIMTRALLFISSLSVLGVPLACSPSSNASGTSTGSENGDGDGDGSPPGNKTPEGPIVPGDGDGDGDGDGEGPPICDKYTARSEPKTPVVYLLLDQSGSMSEPRWSHAKEAIATSSANLEKFAEVGFIGFPTHPITSDSNLSETCAAEVKVAPGGTSTEILASIVDPAPTKGHTPVRAALELVASELASPEYAEQPKYVVLITDGVPNCAAGQAAYVREDPSDAVTTMTENGITTYVVGYDLSDMLSEGIVPSEVANNMAIAGGSERFRDVANGAELNAELEGIRKEVVPCDFELDNIPRGGPTFVRVSVDNVDYAYEVEWNLSGDKTISLREDGAACAVLRDGGQHDINIQVECEPVIPR